MSDELGNSIFQACWKHLNFSNLCGNIRLMNLRWLIYLKGYDQLNFVIKLVLVMDYSFGLLRFCQILKSLIGFLFPYCSCLILLFIGWCFLFCLVFFWNLRLSYIAAFYRLVLLFAKMLLILVRNIMEKLLYLDLILVWMVEDNVFFYLLKIL